MKRPDGLDGVVVALDHHLGTPRALDDRVVGLDLTPAARHALARLGTQLPLGLVVDRTEDDRDAWGTPHAEISLVVDRTDGLGTALREASSRLQIDRGVFVSADRLDRAAAVEAGWRAVPHVSVVAEWMDGHAVVFARLSGGVELRRVGWFVPYLLERARSEWSALGLVTEVTLATACALGVQFDTLDVDPETQDVLQVHLDAHDETALRELRRHEIIRCDGRRVWLALGPEDDPANIDLHGRHGHFVLLGPRPELLADPPESDQRAGAVAARAPRKHLTLVEEAKLDVGRLLGRLCWPSASTFQSDVDRYRGAAPLDASGSIASRHVMHPDNSRVVQALLKDLRDIGYCAYTHAFNYAGSVVRNVIADLPGHGRLVFDPKLLRDLRELLRASPWPDRRWEAAFTEVLGSDWRHEWRLADVDEPTRRIEVEAALGLVPWWPWWRLRCPAPGLGAGLVLVGCHLDSTASLDAGYSPASDPAPGADDDASGIAAVIAAARYLWQFRGELAHTIRFAFFNAEEVGRVGSEAYASKLKSDSAPIKGVVCADMVGFNSNADLLFEVHAGYTDSAVRDKSVPIATVVKETAAAQGNLGVGQIYQGTSWPPPGASDPVLYDGAINRSDHSSFHAQGYAAVVVSEDFFVNLPAEPASDPNPNYHRAGDTTIDASYGAYIACAIAAAARTLAA